MEIIRKFMELIVILKKFIGKVKKDLNKFWKRWEKFNRIFSEIQVNKRIKKLRIF